MNISQGTYQKEWRKLTNNASTKKYEKTRKGFLMRLYRNMMSRISGVQKEKYHLYRDKSILPREEFYFWALNHDEFHRLYSLWEENSYSRKSTPSINRVDPTKGYIIGNMEWLTHSDNSRLGGINGGKLHNGKKGWETRRTKF